MFHAPEKYRYRGNHPIYGDCGQMRGENFGVFFVPIWTGPRNARMAVVCSEGEGWEHVSVSLPDSPRKCPSWDEMSLVKDMFWDGEECVVQFHPPKGDHVNNHTGCLHLWRYVGGEFPTPPSILVGIKELGVL